VVILSCVRADALGGAFRANAIGGHPVLHAASNGEALVVGSAALFAMIMVAMLSFLSNVRQREKSEGMGAVKIKVVHGSSRKSSRKGTLKNLQSALRLARIHPQKVSSLSHAAFRNQPWTHPSLPAVSNLPVTGNDALSCHSLQKSGPGADDQDSRPLSPWNRMGPHSRACEG